ncbi:MAG: hypothetical protein M3R59_11030, partial [Verrucomicrobiota bacterium]|nr:hypothetical protein [Verrucomicrobiota bacterium]
MLHRLLLLPVLSLAACATAPPRVVVVPPSAHNVRGIDPLDVRFSEIDVDRVPIQNAVRRISVAVCQQYGSHYFFSPEFMYATDFMMETP